MAIIKTLGPHVALTCSAAVSAAVLDPELFNCSLPACADGLDIVVMELTNTAAVGYVRQHRHPRDVIRTAGGKRWRLDPATICLITRDQSRRQVFEIRAKAMNGQMLVL